MAATLGFHSLRDERAVSLPVDGSLPDWLAGSLLRNGPGAFELGGASVDHWFDGLAMCHRYTFDGAADAVGYRNRFLRSDAYERAREGSFSGGFATGGAGLLARLWNLFASPPYDNANVVVERVGDDYLAMTESPRRVRVDPATLDTLGHARYEGPAPRGQLACAHVSRDPDGAVVNVETAFGRTSKYHVFAAQSPDERRPIASVPVAEPAYLHDFAATPSYVVLVEFPFVLDPLDLFRPGRVGFVDRFRWEPDRGTRIRVVDRAAGAVVVDATAPPVFGFHHANAYETDDAVVLDVETVPDATPVRDLDLAALRRGDLDALGGRLDRYRVGLDGSVAVDRRYGGATALPTVSPAVEGRRHRYVYAQHGDQPLTEWPDEVVKVDVETGTATTFGPGAPLSEPVFVPRPDGDGEDDGVVLTVALDRAAERSVLHVLDRDLEVLARAPLPHAVPFDFHGRWFPELDRDRVAAGGGWP
jgi:beta-carotene 15,15'-monooxygenase